MAELQRGAGGGGGGAGGPPSMGGMTGMPGGPGAGGQGDPEEMAAKQAYVASHRVGVVHSHAHATDTPFSVKWRKCAAPCSPKSWTLRRARGVWATMNGRRVHLLTRSHSLPHLISHTRLVNRISIVKADKARQVEELIIRMARAGQLQGKIGESQLIDLLEQIRETQEPEATKRVVVCVVCRVSCASGICVSLMGLHALIYSHATVVLHARLLITCIHSHTHI